MRWGGAAVAVPCPPRPRTAVAARCRGEGKGGRCPLRGPPPRPQARAASMPPSGPRNDGVSPGGGRCTRCSGPLGGWVGGRVADGRASGGHGGQHEGKAHSGSAQHSMSVHGKPRHGTGWHRTARTAKHITERQSTAHTGRTWLRTHARTHEAQCPRPNAQGPKPKAQGLRPKHQGPMPQAKGPRPKAQGARPKAQGPTPKAQGPMPKAQGARPKAQGRRLQTKAQGPRPTAQGPRPRARATAEGPRSKANGLKPKAQSPMPKAQGSRPNPMPAHTKPVRCHSVTQQRTLACVPSRPGSRDARLDRGATPCLVPQHVGSRFVRARAHETSAKPLFAKRKNSCVRAKPCHVLCRKMWAVTSCVPRRRLATLFVRLYWAPEMLPIRLVCCVLKH
jgi:hypothetical protein